MNRLALLIKNRNDRRHLREVDLRQFGERRSYKKNSLRVGVSGEKKESVCRAADSETHLFLKIFIIIYYEIFCDFRLELITHVFTDHLVVSVSANARL